MASNQNQEQLTPADIAKLVEAMKESAFTPEKIILLARELNRPYVDEKAVEREKRERAQFRESMRVAVERQREIKERCHHKDAKNSYSVSLVHNFPDHMPRGICMKCHLLIEPEHFDYGADGKAFRIPAHPLYSLVQALDQQISL